MPDDLTEKTDLNCRIFDEKPTIEWAIFIKNNRDRKFSDVSSLECNLDCKYDVVIGPVANDTVGLLIRQFRIISGNPRQFNYRDESANCAYLHS